MVPYSLPLLICTILIKRAVGHDWEGTMVTTPILLKDKLWDFGCQLCSNVVQVKRGVCREASSTRCTGFEALSTAKRNTSTSTATAVDFKKSFRDTNQIHHPEKDGKAQDQSFLNICHNSLTVPINLHNYSTLLENIGLRAWFGRTPLRNRVERLNQNLIVPNREEKLKERPPRRTRQKSRSSSYKANSENNYAKRRQKRCRSSKSDGLPLFLCFVVLASAVLARLGFFLDEKEDSSPDKTESCSFEGATASRTLTVLNPEAEEACQLGASLEVVFVDGPYEDDDCSLQSTQSAREGYPLAPH